jgi:NAD(P)-dependent dehydrogenase (short-subunit alcohol dehydrogenase family)
VEVNLTGIYLVMKTAIPHIVAAGGGAVVNIASLSGLRDIGGRPGYTASKGGLISLTQMAAVEYGEANVRCNVICPGPIRTPLFPIITSGRRMPWARTWNGSSRNSPPFPR